MKDQITFIETTRDEYMQALGEWSPIWGIHAGFLVWKPTSERICTIDKVKRQTRDGFMSMGGSTYFKTNRPVTLKEFYHMTEWESLKIFFDNRKER